jgi:acyl transferase domain-containing protein/acyl carrier protein
MREPQSYKFSLVIRNDDYIVRDHRVHGVRIMPGVTFMDMILRSVQGKGFSPQEVELRNVLFMEPVATSEANDRKVQITMDPRGDHWLINARSQRIVGNQPVDNTWDENLQCELHVRADRITRSIDTEAIKKSAVREMDMDESYAFLRNVDINHFVFMKSLGRLYETPDGLLAELHLSDLAQKYVKNFYLHPVYLDASTIIQAVVLSRNIQNAGISLSEIKPFIPMFIESFRASTRLNETCYVQVREQSNLVATTKDIIYYDIELYDEKGNLACLFTRLAIKQIRSKELIQKLQSLGDEAAPAQAPVPTPVPASVPEAPAPVVAASPSQGRQAVGAGTASAATPQEQAKRMEEHLRGMVAKLLDRRAGEIDLESGFYDQGLDSRHLLQLVQDLEGQLGQQLYPTLLFEYTNIHELAGYLAEEFGDITSGAASAAQATTGAQVAAGSAGQAMASATAGAQGASGSAGHVTASAAAPTANAAATPSLPLDHLIQNDLRSMVGTLLNIRPEEVDLESGFYDQGLDSRHLLQLVQDLEQKLGSQLYPTLLFEYTNIRELAGYLAEEHGASYRPQTAATVQAAQKDDSVQTVFFHRVWEAANVAPDANSNTAGTYLLFDRDTQLRDVLQARLGANVVLVQPGSGFREVAPNSYELDPASFEHYAQLLITVQASGALPTRILHRWSQEPFTTGDEALAEQLKNGFYSFFLLSKALMAQKPKEKTRLISLYDSGTEDVQPQYAAVGGFARAAGRENPRYFAKTLELRGADKIEPSRLADLIVQEWAVEDETEVRYENGQRFVKRMTEAYPTPSTGNDVPLKNGGVYLITGGAGGLGLLFARYIAERVPAKLVLTGRSQLSADKQAQLQELERLGSEVLYVAADVAKRADAERLVADTKSRFGKVDGVIHSAGVVRDAFVMEKKTEEIDAVLAPKVQGTVLLDELLQGEALDFFVLFSSIAVLGNVGQSDYGYANAFLDTFAERREAQRARGERSGRTVSINWPLWKDGGMQIDEHGVKMMRERMGMAALTNENGLRAFEAAYRLASHQTVVLEGEKDRILQGLGVRTTAQAQGQSAPNAAHAAAPAPTAAPQQSATQPSQPTTAPAQPAAQPQQPAAAVQPTRPNIAHQQVEEDIAIIGLSGRYPQARNVGEYWNNLKSGRDSITEIPSGRWDWRKDYDPDKQTRGKTYAKWGGFLDDIDKFDPLFFNISPIEAEFTDPQERLFLETVWETMEDAGYLKNGFAKQKVGVFVGVMWSQYQLYGAEEALNGNNVSLGGNISSIANRVSYFFNFNGPSIALDTMCSSSLTSLHFAVESLKRGECEVAVAGGVNLSVHPQKYILLAQGKFAASDGRCRAFGADGDGYVPGEGVGAVLLKALSKAIADGDQIYGIVKATAINHGGKTSGFYVPSPVGQGHVIADALDKANIDPRTISYLEAHGTGTSLGDPIEINGLSKAFGRSADKQFCAIGSVKSNIGHLESAAGIAGITKILLQMKHRQLVPSLHAETLNPNINFAASPFRVQRELTDWQQPVIVENGVATTYPRRAGLSSFGAGGANAHVIIEEFIAPAASVTPNATTSNDPTVIVLSARNEQRLRDYAEKLQAFVADALAGNQQQNVRLEDIAYTLQTGREAMEERLALVVTNLQDLHEKLSRFGEGKANVEGVFAGNVRRGREKTELLLDGREGEQFVQIIVQDKKLAKLAQLWVNGLNLNWSLLHAPGVRHISLPTYPFAKERYWVPQLPEAERSHVATTVKLHPFVERNTSTLQEQKFTSRFSGGEFVFRDHVINGQKLLPGVAYLEMARAAGELAAEVPVRFVKNVIWSAPVVASAQGAEVSVSLYPTDDKDDEVEYEVWTADEEGERIVHSSGTLVFDENETDEQPTREILDLDAAKHRCQDVMSGEAVYEGFATIGFAYGSGLRAIRELRASDTEALSRLELPGELLAASGDYVLHPSLLDGALQTVAGMLSRRADSNGGKLPFAVGEVEIVGPLTSVCYAHATLTEHSGSLTKFQILLVDEKGEVLVRLRDFALKSFQSGGDEAQELMNLLQQIENGTLLAEEADKMMEGMKR